MDFTETLNFSSTHLMEKAAKLHKNRDFGYYYDSLYLYCTNNGINPKRISEEDFSAAATLMKMHGTEDPSTDHYFFWLDD